MSLIHRLTPVGGVILAAPMAATIEHAAQPEIRRLSFVPSPFAAAGNGPRSRLSEGAVSLIYNPLALAENQPYAIVALAVAGTLDWPDLDAALQVAFKLFGPSVELTAVFDFWAALPREVDLGHKERFPCAFEDVAGFYELMLRLRKAASGAAGISFDRGNPTGCPARVVGGVAYLVQ